MNTHYNMWSPKTLALLLSLALASLPALADVADRMQSALLSGSERLRLRAFGQALTEGQLSRPALNRMRQDMVAQGYYVDGGPPQLVARDIAIAPVLTWDGNVNGGVLQDRFTLNGWVFTADPGFRAKAGLVAGASVAGMARLAWGNGRLIELRGATEIGWSPRHDIGRADAMLAVCSRNHLRGWDFLDLCATGSRSWRDLGDDSAHRLGADFSRIVTAPHSLHEIKVGYALASTSGQKDQHRASLGLESVWNHAVTDFRLTLGRPVDGITVPRQRLDAGIAWLAAGRRWHVDLWHQRAEGGTFGRTARADRATGIGLEVDLRPGTALRLGYMDSRSTAEIATYDQFTLEIRLDRLRW